MPPSHPLTVRPYRPADAAPIAALFHDTIHAVNRADYTPDQLAAWAPPDARAAAADHWAAKLARGYTTFVATPAPLTAADDAEVIGFATLEPDGHLDHLFVHHRHQRQGVATALHIAVESTARRAGVPRLFTEASLTARPFFLRQGYAELRRHTVTINGVGLTNFAMAKPLDGR